MILSKVPLSVDVGVVEAGLPESGHILQLSLAGVSRYCSEHHQTLALFGELQHGLRIGSVQFA